jgi:hypothetical protein
MFRKRVVLLIFIGFAISVASSEAQTKSTFKAGAKVFIASMPDGFDTYLKSAMEKKKVSLAVVESKENADFEITGSSDTQKAGAAKKIIRLNWHSAEQASISISDLKTGEVVFAYSVNKESSAHGKQSTAEACAKHIKEVLEKK